MKKYFLTALILVVSVVATAQSSKAVVVDKYKADLMKAMVKLLAADKANYKNVPDNFCHKCETVAEIMLAAEDSTSGLSPAIGKLRELQNVKMDTSSIGAYTTAANQIQKELVNALTSGKNAGRKDWPVFKEFEAMLIDAERSTAEAYKKAGGGANLPAEEKKQVNTDMPQSSPSGSSLLSYLLLLIPLGVAVYALMQNVKLQRTISRLEKKIGGTPGNDDAGDQESISLGNIAYKVKAIENRLNQPSNSDQIIHDEIAELKKMVNDLTKQLPAAKVETASVSEPAPVVATKSDPLPPVILFANYPDGLDGFGKSSLKEKNFSGALYIITLNEKNDHRATFKISDDEDAKRNALRYKADYIDKACEVVESPPDRSFSSLRMRMDGEGELVLEGNIWRIIKKVKIDII